MTDIPDAVMRMVAISVAESVTGDPVYAATMPVIVARFPNLFPSVEAYWRLSVDEHANLWAFADPAGFQAAAEAVSG